MIRWVLFCFPTVFCKLSNLTFDFVQVDAVTLWTAWYVWKLMNEGTSCEDLMLMEKNSAIFLFNQCPPAQVPVGPYHLLNLNSNSCCLGNKSRLVADNACQADFTMACPPFSRTNPCAKSSYSIYYLQYFCRSWISSVLALYILGFPSLHKEYLWTVNIIWQKRIYSMRPATPDIFFAVFPLKFWDLILLFLSAHSLGFDLDKVQISFCLVRNVFLYQHQLLFVSKHAWVSSRSQMNAIMGPVVPIFSGGPQLLLWSTLLSTNGAPM